MTGTQRKVEIEKVEQFSNDVNTYGNYLMDSLNRITGDIGSLKTNQIIQGDVAQKLEILAGDARKTANEMNDQLNKFSQKISKIAAETKELDEEAARKLTSDALFEGVNYNFSGNHSSASLGPTGDVQNSKVNIDEDAKKEWFRQNKTM